MNEQLLNNVSIRVTTKSNGHILNGSGILIQNTQKVNYVVTAEHCINGKAHDRLTNITHQNVLVQFRNFENGDLLQLKTKDIIYSNQNEDIAIIELEELPITGTNVKVGLFSNINDLDTLHFRGFPKWLDSNNEPNTYSCRYINNRDKSSFIIKSDDIIDPTSLKSSELTASGLSGSGVFLYRNNSLYLLGIITDLRVDNGTFGHLVCKKLDTLCERFNIEISNPHSPKGLLDWSKNVDKREISEKIESLKSENNKQFDDLFRKCTILYEENALEMTYFYLEQYFRLEIQLRKIQKNNFMLYSNIESAAEILRDKVKMSYNNRIVVDKNEAQKILESIINFFEDKLNKEYSEPIKSSDLNNSGKGAVTELLLNCDLDFIKK